MPVCTPHNTQPQSVATRRVRNFGAPSWRRQLSSILRVLKVREKLRRIHGCRPKRTRTLRIRLASYNVCNWPTPRRPPRRPVIKVAAALIVRNGEILIGQRRRPTRTVLNGSFRAVRSNEGIERRGRARTRAGGRTWRPGPDRSRSRTLLLGLSETGDDSADVS